MASPQSVSAYRLLSRVFKCLVTLGWRYDSLPPSHHHPLQTVLPPHQFLHQTPPTHLWHHLQAGDDEIRKPVAVTVQTSLASSLLFGVKPNLTHTHTHTRDDLPHLEQPPFSCPPSHWYLCFCRPLALSPFLFLAPFRHSDALYLFLIFSGSLISVRCCFSRK